ncbi:MAG: SDR family NAD(P)-dependent oxidoreductase [Methylocella sp.]
MSFEGKVVWVTGASSGIGEALTKAMVRVGAAVILSGRRVQELERVAAEVGGKTFILPFEVTDYDALPGVVERAWKWRGAIDLLINNAGISQRSLALDTHFETYRRLIEVDYLAPLQLTQLVLPRMVEQGKGHIAAVSSVAGKLGLPLRTGYPAAKHAVMGYFDALRAEVETAYDIKVSVIVLGSVKTAISLNALNGDGSRHGRSSENIDNGMAVGAAAERILSGLSEGQREIIVAEGRELAGLQARLREPESLFALMAAEGARLAALRDEVGP